MTVSVAVEEELAGRVPKECDPGAACPNYRNREKGKRESGHIAETEQ